MVFSAGWHREAYRTDLPRDCRDCQTSCQSACKTSCTVSNQSCPLDNAG
ncbi:MAG TPA: six-cysteine peptide SCIFF [Clostridiales bacterium]|nr:six-cysteine peptide SCIFF [Clostridiales bacterium]